MQSWKFIYTSLPNIKKALTKDSQPKPGVTHYIVTTGKDFAECYGKARREGKFKESQLIGSSPQFKL